MKKTKHFLAAAFAAASLALACASSQAQTTNLMLYNFNTDQVSSSPYGTSWGNWFGGYLQSVVWDSSNDANNNPNSGSMEVTINCTGSDQLCMFDGGSPSYGPVNLTIFTNLSFDVRYDASSAIRTNADGSQDFGDWRVGTRNPSWSQDWIYYFAIPATNSAGQPNTNWIHVNVDLQKILINYPDLSAGWIDLLIGMDGANYGNKVLVGQQMAWFDNFQFSGYVFNQLPPTLGIQKAVPALRFFGGNGVYGRSQVSLVDLNDGWIGGSYPATYSFTLLGNATSPGNLDTHIQFIPLDQDTTSYEGNSGADYWKNTELWLRLISGSGTNTTCVADISWKTNAGFSNPNRTDLMITNPVRSGTWTLTFNGPVTGTLTAPGAAPVPFTLSMSPTDATNNFSGVEGPYASSTPGVGIRIGNMNNGNTANAGVPDDWAGISVSGPAGTNFTASFIDSATWQIDTNVWDLANSDGSNMQVLVPTNAPYWITWNTPDTGFALATATSLDGPWHLPEYYNDFEDGSNTLASESLHVGEEWNLILPQYLPTSNGNPGGPISPTAFFSLQNPPPTQ
jgi:hypothetical protein